MSPSSALQVAVVEALRADAAVSAIVGARVYDVPPVAPDYPFVSLGPTSVITGRPDGYRQRTEVIQVDAWAEDERQRQPIKALCDAILEVLDQADLDLAGPHGLARMDLVLMRVMDDPDGITKHGVLQFECEITSPARHG